eukprot:TRINITY_DN17679_c0_g1_i1.p2 TRINITY_DN17679_c0_g1~~TRINITY_DN17679_c0_g1_i1.p2  ORF type:complete len:142 (-),score=23.50 TRINITY_DN17679_c0_g1_i1:330-734(-)
MNEAAAQQGIKLVQELVQTVLSFLQEQQVSVGSQEFKLGNVKPQLDSLLQDIEEAMKKCCSSSVHAHLNGHGACNGQNKNDEEDEDMDSDIRLRLEHLEQEVKEKQQILEEMIPQVRKFADMLCITELDPHKFK